MLLASLGCKIRNDEHRRQLVASKPVDKDPLVVLKRHGGTRVVGGGNVFGHGAAMPDDAVPGAPAGHTGREADVGASG